MIASWMLYCTTCALVLSVAALLAERALLAGRGPVRQVWIGAVLLSLLVPAGAYRLAQRVDPVEFTTDVAGDIVTTTLPDLATPLSPAPRSEASHTRDMRATLARFDQPLLFVWIALSFVLAINFLGGIATLARMRRGWTRTVVRDVPVFVSERTGPALVGAISPAIVVPEWALSLEPAQLDLLLRHEQEHRRARDGQLLAAVQVALIAMPWNGALWWQLMRLRVAVELDCDARVLRSADARMYGALLLEVARPRRGFRLMGATSFAERATQLDRRIRVLGRHRVRTSGWARALATTIALAAVTVAWAAPHPDGPITLPARAPSDTPPLLVSQERQQLAPADTGTVAARQPVTATIPAKTAVAPLVAPIIAAPMAEETLVMSRANDSIFYVLFDGIALTRDQESKARAIVAGLAQVQATQDETSAIAMTAFRLQVASLQAKRDEGLRALLTNDSDRATFDARRATQAAGAGGGGRGGRVGVMSVADTVASAGVGRGGTATLSGGFAGARGGGGGGRGGAGTRIATLDSGAVMRAGRVVNVNQTTVAFRADLTLRSLFQGISLTPEQEAQARDLIVSMQEDSRTRFTVPPAALRLNPNTGIVTMQADSESALLALIAGSEDRAKFKSRILVPLR